MKKRSGGVGLEAISYTFDANQVFFGRICSIMIANRSKIAISTRQVFDIANRFWEANIIEIHHFTQAPELNLFLVFTLIHQSIFWERCLWKW